LTSDIREGRTHESCQPCENTRASLCGARSADDRKPRAIVAARQRNPRSAAQVLETKAARVSPWPDSSDASAEHARGAGTGQRRYGFQV